MTNPLDEALRHRAEGLDAPRTAGLLVASGATAVEAIKAIRAAFGVSLGQAKEIVHPVLSAEQRASAERLWDEAEASVRESD